MFQFIIEYVVGMPISDISLTFPTHYPLIAVDVVSLTANLLSQTEASIGDDI